MGPVRQNPIQRTFSLFICACIALCTIVAHNIAQNRLDSFPPYPPDNHHISDDVYLREGGLYNCQSVLVKLRSKTCKTQKLVSWKIWISWARTFVHGTLDIIFIVVWLVRCWTLPFLRACCRLDDSVFSDRRLPDQCWVVLNRIQWSGAGMTWSARLTVPVPWQKGHRGPKGSTVVHRCIGTCNVTEELKADGTDDVCEWWLMGTSTDLLITNVRQSQGHHLSPELKTLNRTMAPAEVYK